MHLSTKQIMKDGIRFQQIEHVTVYHLYQANCHGIRHNISH